MRRLVVAILFAVGALVVAPGSGRAHWVSLAPPPVYPYAYPSPYAYGSPYAYPGYAVPTAPCVLGPAGPLCSAGAYYPGWQFRREWDTDYIWRNTGPHVRGYTLH